MTENTPTWTGDPTSEEPILAARRRIAGIRSMLITMLVAPFLITVVGVVAIPEWTTPPVWITVAQIVLVIAAFVAVRGFGYRAKPIDPLADTETAVRHAVNAWTSTTFTRMALTEAVIFLGVTFGFVAESRWPVVFGLILGWPLLAWEIIPTRRTVGRLKERLEREHGQSHLERIVLSQ